MSTKSALSGEYRNVRESDIKKFISSGGYSKPIGHFTVIANERSTHSRQFLSI
jgi:hypothetical protein